MWLARYRRDPPEMMRSLRIPSRQMTEAFQLAREEGLLETRLHLIAEPMRNYALPVLALRNREKLGEWMMVFAFSLREKMRPIESYFPPRDSFPSAIEPLNHLVGVIPSIRNRIDPLRAERLPAIPLREVNRLAPDRSPALRLARHVRSERA